MEIIHCGIIKLGQLDNRIQNYPETKLKKEWNPELFFIIQNERLRLDAKKDFKSFD